MGNLSLDDIQVTPLARIATPGGDVLHAMKAIDAGYAGFGEAYFSWVDVGAVKAWKKHTRMTMNVVVPIGLVRFVFSLKADGPFRSEDIGTAGNYARISVPPGIWFGFQGLASMPSLILNLANIPHDPAEVARLGTNDMEYSWK